MTATNDPPSREKVAIKLPPPLRQKIKVRAAQLGLDMQDAVTEAIEAWMADDAEHPMVETTGAANFTTHLPKGMNDKFRKVAKSRKSALNQALAQALTEWLRDRPASHKQREATGPVRFIVCNQKGGVGKTAISAGLAEGIAERDARVLLVDFDPQCHLTQQLGHKPLGIDDPSLAKRMLGEEKKVELRSLVVPVESEQLFGDRLHLLPGSTYAFLLDAKLATAPGLRVRESALERELLALEEDYDYIIVDCPPSLGYTMDNALYYGRTRDGEDPDSSGIVIVVQAEDSSADAYELLMTQISALAGDMNLPLALLGIVVNLYDSRRGYIATSSLQGWRDLGTPPVLGVIPDLKEQREAVRVKQPLLEYAPESEQASSMRELTRRLVG
ncbi:ParA family protein [Streptomyces sp. KS 21]|uniref:ParA family protein n=1 Tax=Streptomyces sp. KS 21 TaxID=2485150 RepID=UPI0010627C0D|nr:ParA family protein [Streptomyces sp. KS 21]TDU67909.1 chromosome partitioning protein [Streptomyces sp. KS 21]